MNIKRKFQVGDSVKVISGTKDPDFEIDIGGWQGHITEIENDHICIDWDSDTLSLFPDKYISQCEEDGLDWERIYLEETDIELVAPRNTNNDLYKKREEIQLKHCWDYIGDSGKRISRILEHVDPDDDQAISNAWENYLKESLSFPFNAKISDYQEKGPLHQGDKVKINGISGYEDLYGIIVKLRLCGKAYHFPLCGIDVSDDKSHNYKIIEDYNNWFANSRNDPIRRMMPVQKAERVISCVIAILSD